MAIYLRIIKKYSPEAARQGCLKNCHSERSEESAWMQYCCQTDPCLSALLR